MRTMNFVRYFGKLGDVDLAYCWTGDENRPVRGPFRKEYRIDMESSGNGNGSLNLYRDFRDRVRRLAERRPWIVTEWPKGAIARLHDILRQEHYDFILCRYMRDGYPFLGVGRPLREQVIVDFDDVLSTSLFEAKVGGKTGICSGIRRNLQRKFLIDYQKRFLGLGAALFCSEEDRDEVTDRNPVPNTFIVPNTYPASARPGKSYGKGFPHRRTLLFVGALDYAPNRSGLKWFVDSIFPGVKRRYPDARLLVVGRKPPGEIAEICAKCPGVELHPDVPDVKPYYEKCGAVVIPLRSGGGTRIKILEAAMAGRPVLSTPVGAYGLGCEDGVHLMLFDDGDGFLERLERLDGEETYDRCVENMRAVVEKRYSPEAFERTMSEVVRRLLRETKEIAGEAFPS